MELCLVTQMISVNKTLNSEHDLLPDIFTLHGLHWVYWHCFGSRVWWILEMLNSCYWSMLGWMSAFRDCCYEGSACWPAGCVEMAVSWNNVSTRSLRFLVYNHSVTFISYGEVSCLQSKWKLIIWRQTFYDWDAWCPLSVWMPDRLNCLRTAYNGEVWVFYNP